jgi:hypothetical protein
MIRLDPPGLSVHPSVPGRRAENGESDPSTPVPRWTDRKRHNPAPRAEVDGWTDEIVRLGALHAPVVPIAPHIRPAEDVETEAPAREPERPRRASARGTDDDLCHVLVNVGLGGYSRTVCGQRLVPPLSRGETHAPPPKHCPGGWASCPACAQGAP